MNKPRKSRWKAGDRAESQVDVTDDLVDAFATYSGDYNPIHLDAEYASGTSFKRPIAHGMSYASLFSRLIGMDIPGPGAVWAAQSFRFIKPAYVGDRLTLSIEIEAIKESAGLMVLACKAVNQLDELIMEGTGEIMLVEPEESAPETRDGPGVALVTGGSRGIGAAIVRRLTAEGHRVAFTYTQSKSEAEALTKELDNSVALSCDAADPEAMQVLAGDVARLLGEPVRILVINASSRDLYGEAANGDFEQFRRHLAISLEGSHSLVSACLPAMLDTGNGSIVAIGSTYARGAPPKGMSPYIIGKAALESYMRCLAIEYGGQGIRANLVLPSLTDTALAAGVPTRTRKVMAAQNPMRRIATPEDVANAVAFLVNPDSSYVTGHSLTVSGGSVMP